MLVGEQLIFLLISLNLALADKRDPTYKGLQSQGVYEAVAEVESDQLWQTETKMRFSLHLGLVNTGLLTYEMHCPERS